MINATYWELNVRSMASKKIKQGYSDVLFDFFLPQPSLSTTPSSQATLRRVLLGPPRNLSAPAAGSFEGPASSTVIVREPSEPVAGLASVASWAILRAVESSERTSGANEKSDDKRNIGKPHIFHDYVNICCAYTFIAGTILHSLRAIHLTDTKRAAKTKYTEDPDIQRDGPH
jgi:hypothetical protein